VRHGGRRRARLLALGCSRLPEGRNAWTLRLPVGRLVEQEVAPSRWRRRQCGASRKNEDEPHLKEQWAILPAGSAGLVARMEDLLELYQRPFDAKHRLACIDELPKQPGSEARLPLLAATSARTARFDYEFRRSTSQP
jgi:hypothetical protein